MEVNWKINSKIPPRSNSAKHLESSLNSTHPGYLTSSKLSNLSKPQFLHLAGRTKRYSTCKGTNADCMLPTDQGKQ